MLVGIDGENPYDAITIKPRHRKERRGTLLCPTRREHVVRKFPFDLHVGDIKQTFKRTAFELDAETLAHRALRPIASNQILCANRLLLTAGAGNRGCYFLLVLRKL